MAPTRLSRRERACLDKAAWRFHDRPCTMSLFDAINDTLGANEAVRVELPPPGQVAGLLRGLR